MVPRTPESQRRCRGNSGSKDPQSIRPARCRTSSTSPRFYVPRVRQHMPGGCMNNLNGLFPKSPDGSTRIRSWPLVPRIICPRLGAPFAQNVMDDAHDATPHTLVILLAFMPLCRTFFMLIAHRQILSGLYGAMAKPAICHGPGYPRKTRLFSLQSMRLYPALNLTASPHATHLPAATRLNRSSSHLR